MIIIDPRTQAKLLYDDLDSPIIENEQWLSTDHCECNDLFIILLQKVYMMNTNGVKYFKRYVGEEYWICKETIFHGFNSKNIVGLSRSHLTHLNCHLTFDESGLNNGVLRRYGICNIEVSPKNPEFVNS